MASSISRRSGASSKKSRHWKNPTTLTRKLAGGNHDLAIADYGAPYRVLSAAPCAGRRRVADSSRSESPAPGLASRGLVGCAGRHAVIAGGERDRAPLETAVVAPPRGRRNPDPASDERYE